MCELYLLRGKVYELMGEHRKGTKFVLKYAKYIVDDVRRNEMLVRMYMGIPLPKKAIECLENLI